VIGVDVSDASPPRIVSLGCSIALGAIVEAVAGMPFERFVAEHVLAPAGLRSTGYPHSDALESDIAISYTRRTPDGALRSNMFMHGASGSAAGAAYSTSLDLLAFVTAVRVATPHRLANARPAPTMSRVETRTGPYGWSKRIASANDAT
jgi:CubicO group peptidase (beta-lactamase class C family)